MNDKMPVGFLKYHDNVNNMDTYSHYAIRLNKINSVCFGHTFNSPNYLLIINDIKLCIPNISITNDIIDNIINDILLHIKFNSNSDLNLNELLEKYI